jgi:hypothetical protein
MANISLEGAIRTCKVDTAYANKVESDRFLNPENMVCPVWNGYDITGRRVCPDSFVTKRAGCNSAEDRVVVENNQRPQYMEYVNLSANGIDGDIYGCDMNTGWMDCNMNWVTSGERTQDLRNVNNITGNFGKQFGANVFPSCAYYPYNRAMAQEHRCNREVQAMQNGYDSHRYRMMSNNNNNYA